MGLGCVSEVKQKTMNTTSNSWPTAQQDRCSLPVRPGNIARVPWRMDLHWTASIHLCLALHPSQLQ